jgi:glycosyltransferase involved in cell wall biosynthesis
MEAVASEVALLRLHNPGSVVWGINSSHWARWTRRGGFHVGPRLHLLFRLLTAILEPLFDINHIFGSLSDWYYLRSVRRRPTILTLATAGPVASTDLLNRVDHFVVETPEALRELDQVGISHNRVSLILPPVDLLRFQPQLPPSGPFTVLFASSPERANWLEARGVHLILESAALRPQYHFRLLWRPWGDSESMVRQWINDRQLENVEVIVGRQPNMAEQYAQAHVTIAPFVDSNCCKPLPNSILESMASGRPVLVTDLVGLGEEIERHRAGFVSEATVPALIDRLDQLRSNWHEFARPARAFAEKRFSLDRFVTAYHQLYRKILTTGSFVFRV